MLNVEMEKFDRVQKTPALLHMYVIYEKPSDFPNDYVARRWEGIKDGDEVFAPDYFSWITGKHTAFREIKKCGYYNGFPPDVQKDFETFIKEVRK